jgi:hypothetical protein
MSRAVDYTIYVLVGFAAAAGIVIFARNASPQAARVFRGVMDVSLLGIPCWLLGTSIVKRLWPLAVLALLAEALTISQLLAPRESPVGMHQAGVYMALPLLLFEKASTKTQKLAVILGCVLTAGAIIVNMGVLGFRDAAIEVSWAMMAVYLALFVLRFRSRRESRACDLSAETPHSSDE